MIITCTGIHSRSDKEKTEAEGSFFNSSWLLHYMDQMLVAWCYTKIRFVIQNCQTFTQDGVQYMEHTVSMWSTVCLIALHSQFCIQQKQTYLIYFLFYLCVYPPDSQESNGGANC